ncbi:MAG: hypothetical protein LBE18_02460 [Planctomycetaceae bacterium]|jgi:DNA mismatch repair ATPase MutL|nr:hypothetical protein [Planctomycetaceae bacterium]
MKKIIVTKITIADLYDKIKKIILSPALVLIVSALLLSACEGTKPKQRPGSDSSAIQSTPATTSSTSTSASTSTSSTSTSTSKASTSQEKTPETKKSETQDTKKSGDKNITAKPKNNDPNQKENSNNTKVETSNSPVSSKTETLVKAEVGAGAKGHYGGEKSVMAPILVPLGTYWRASEMTTYNIQIPKAMQLYKATHENKAPETHDEFMEEIIKKENIKLPQLPSGCRYIYDPADEQLKIAKPAN